MKNNKFTALSIRFETEQLDFLKKRAQQNGISLADYVRRTVLQGIISESAQEISERMTELSEQHFEAITLFGNEGRNILFTSVLETNYLLKEIIKDRDPNRIKEAANFAKEQLVSLQNNA